MPTSFIEFTQNVNDSNICINQSILEVKNTGSPTPDAWYVAIANAGEALRAEQAGMPIPLADQLIPADYIDMNNIKEVTLRSILNASRARVPLGDEGISYFCQGVKRLDMCSEVESSFSATIDAMTHPYDKPALVDGRPFGWSIIENEGKAVGITKNLGAMSTLSLETITINGVPYPPGSLLRAHPSYVQWDKATDKHVIPSVSIGRAAFYRLTAFALEPQDRRPDFEEAMNSAYDVPADPLEHWSMNRIRRVAQTALEAQL